MSGNPQHPQQYPQQPYPQPGYPQPGYPPAPAMNPFSDQAPNPYASPQQASYYQQPAPQKPSAYAGLWRQGNVLVMHKLAPLPDICLKSNQPATRRLRRTMYWHQPWFYIIFLISPLIYIIVAMIVQKNATIQIGLTDDWYSRRQRRMLVSWLTFLACGAMLFVGIANAESADWAPLLILLGIVGGLAAAITGLIICRLVTPERITDEYVWVKGVHPEFLNRLDVWPYHI
jgi:hypothetical protein